MKSDELIEWLLEGDVAIQYQVSRDLLSDGGIREYANNGYRYRTDPL